MARTLLLIATMLAIVICPLLCAGAIELMKGDGCCEKCSPSAPPKCPCICTGAVQAAPPPSVDHSPATSTEAPAWLPAPVALSPIADGSDLAVATRRADESPGRRRLALHTLRI